MSVGKGFVLVDVVWPHKVGAVKTRRFSCYAAKLSVDQMKYMNY